MLSTVQRYREEVSKFKDPRMKKEGEPDIQYPTGFLTLDFANGCIMSVKPQDGRPPFSYVSLGITDGACMEILGRPGCGKTTLSIQIAARITERFEGSSIYHDDIEGGTNDIRKKVLTGWDNDTMQAKYRYRNSGITVENFYQSIKALHDVKLANYDEMSYDTGLYDTYGNKITKLIPDIYFLDSVPMLIPDKLTEEEELSGSMSATAAAKTNTLTLKRVIPMLKATNIILIAINHINDDVSFMPKKPDMAWLKQGETLPGGRIWKYTPNLIIRMDENTKLSEDKDLGINGIIVDAMICKSRTGRAGRICTLVFDYEHGFDADLSLFVAMRSAKVINQSGAYLSLDGYDKKFYQKDFKDKLENDPEFAEAFSRAATKYLRSILNSDDQLAEESAKSRKASISIINMLNAEIMNESVIQDAA